MTTGRRIAALLLALTLLAPGLPAASAAYVTVEQAVDTLSALGLLRGTETGFDLERAATREEAVTLLVRLLGGEAEALESGAVSPFSDVSGWAEPYVAWGYGQALINGVSADTLDARAQVTAQAFAAMTLRALGYSEQAGDFTYAGTLDFADEIGLTHGEYDGAARPFLREDAALMLYTALTLDLADGSQKLVEKLLADGAITREALLGTRLARYANSGKRAWSAAEIYERCSSAVFLVEAYDSAEAYEKQAATGTASGFFISPDGLALMSYHGVENMCAARITTADGRVYALEQIVWYDSYRDIVLARIARTSLDGQTLRAFPYIDLGDPAALGVGDRVYTLSCPIGLRDCLSDGLVSGLDRIADDPAYPFVQFTAPISQGSSGGVLLNEYGEAVGVIMGAFNGGNALNLAVPVDCLDGVDFDAAGQSLQAVYETEKAKNAASTLQATQTELTLEVGQTAEIVLTRDCPGSVSLQYFCSDNRVLSCRWGTFTTKTTVPLYITAAAPGSATVTVTYAEGYGNPEAEVVITVTVPETEGEAG